MMYAWIGGSGVRLFVGAADTESELKAGLVMVQRQTADFYAFSIPDEITFDFMPEYEGYLYPPVRIEFKTEDQLQEFAKKFKIAILSPSDFKAKLLIINPPADEPVVEEDETKTIGQMIGVFDRHDKRSDEQKAAWDKKQATIAEAMAKKPRPIPVVMPEMDYTKNKSAIDGLPRRGEKQASGLVRIEFEGIGPDKSSLIHLSNIELCNLLDIDPARVTDGMLKTANQRWVLVSGMKAVNKLYALLQADKNILITAADIVEEDNTVIEPLIPDLELIAEIDWTSDTDFFTRLTVTGMRLDKCLNLIARHGFTDTMRQFSTARGQNGDDSWFVGQVSHDEQDIAFLAALRTIDGVMVKVDMQVDRQGMVVTDPTLEIDPRPWGAKTAEFMAGSEDERAAWMKTLKGNELYFSLYKVNNKVYLRIEPIYTYDASQGTKYLDHLDISDILTERAWSKYGKNIWVFGGATAMSQLTVKLSVLGMTENLYL